MTALLEKPFGEIIDATPAPPTPSEELAQALAARMAAETYRVAAHAISAADLAATSLPDLVALVARFVGELSIGTTRARVAMRGQVALMEALERSGGVWQADEAQEQLDVTRETLRRWRDDRKVLALPTATGSFRYPVGQFARSHGDDEPFRPLAGLNDVLARIGDRLTPEETLLLLATPQRAWEGRSGFAALANGDMKDVIQFVTHVVKPQDADAPPTRTAS
jgi:hypothetical protein